MWKSCQSEKENAEWSPGVGLSKYRHQASHRNCAGTPSTLFGCIQQGPPTTPVLRKTPLQNYIVYDPFNTITGILYDNQNIKYGT